MLRLAAALEQGSQHPIGDAVRRAHEDARDGAVLPKVEDFRVLPGKGVEGRLAGERYELVRGHSPDGTESVVELRGREGVLATLSFRASLEPFATEAVHDLRALGLEMSILTGDSESVGAHVGKQLGIEAHAELLPADKVEIAKAPGHVFVGDGLNDTGALAAADVGIAVAEGVPAAKLNSDVHFVRARLDALPWLFELSRKATAVARANLFWACAYNAVGLWLAVQGRLTPVLAAAAMVLSSLLVVLNSSRLGGFRRGREASALNADDLRTPAKGVSVQVGFE